MRTIYGYKDFLAIPPGETRVFEFTTPGAMISCESTGRQTQKLHPRPDILRYQILRSKKPGDELKLFVTPLPIPKTEDNDK